MTHQLITRVLASTLVTTAACHGASGRTLPDHAEDAAPVGTAAVTEDRIALPVIATGTLGPKEEIALSFKIGGVVRRIRVDAGATVRAGDLLAALDLGEIDAAVTRAQSAADKAERDLLRAGRLYRDSVVTLVQLQDAETGAQLARADLQAARFNRRHAVIVAPADGVILARHAEPGELVAPGAPIVVLGSRARGAVVRVGLADRDVLRVQRGDRAVVRFAAVGDREFAGSVAEIAGAADPFTGTYRVEVILPRAAGLASGLVGRVEIRPEAAQPVRFVPTEAVVEADGGRGTVFALAADGRRVERREVTIAFLAGDRVAVASGLDGVRRVITAGAAYLDDGQTVEVRP